MFVKVPLAPLRIAIGDSSLVRYPQGGGHWTVYLQYLLGLRALGHEVTLLELVWSTGEEREDQVRIARFIERLARYGLGDRAAVLLFPKGQEAQELDSALSHPGQRADIKSLLRHTDVFWNCCCGIRQPLLDLFPRRALLDLDPGHLQISALTEAMDVERHHAFLTVGRRLGQPGCDVPTLGLSWKTFTPFVYLPMWQAQPDPGYRAPFSSITHWEWGELSWGGCRLSISKRDAYLRFLDLPTRAGRPFELAANIHPDDATGDRELLERHGWRLSDPWEVADSPEAYQAYIGRSRAEFGCAKPIFCELRTGWFSDRSACYLASGRPVLAEDTGFSEHLPVGEGLLSFNNMDEALSGVREIDRNYARHSRAARAFAEAFLDSGRVLGSMIEACR
jgi:hypothetical protein